MKDYEKRAILERIQRGENVSKIDSIFPLTRVEAKVLKKTYKGVKFIFLGKDGEDNLYQFVSEEK